MVEDGVRGNLENVLSFLDLILIEERFDQSAIKANALSMERHDMLQGLLRESNRFRVDAEVRGEVSNICENDKIGLTGESLLPPHLHLRVVQSFLYSLLLDTCLHLI